MIDKIVKRKDGTISRTQIINSITAISGVLLVTLPNIQAQIEPDVYGWIVMMLGTVNLYLRKTTTKI